jgi:hypothetical protein
MVKFEYERTEWNLGALIYFCLSNLISFHNTPLNGVQVVLYVQTNERKDGRAEQFLIPKTK